MAKKQQRHEFSYKQSTDRFQIMAMVSNPDDFVSWPHEQQVRFYEKAVKWHEWIADLQRNPDPGRGFVTEAWGTQTIPGMAVNPSKLLLVALFDATFDQFSKLLTTEDPLWNLAIYQAPALLPVKHETAKNDFEDDWQGHLRLRAFVEKQLGKRLLGRGKPKPPQFDKQLIHEDLLRPGGNLQFMVTLQNTDGYVDLPDLEKLRLDERLLLMHSYHEILREAGVITHEWGCYQNYGIYLEPGEAKRSGRHIYQVHSVNQFDALLLLDPMREVTLLRTLMLLPLDQSKTRIDETLRHVRAHP